MVGGEFFIWLDEGFEGVLAGEIKKSLPSRWPFDLFPISIHVQISLRPAAIGGRRVGALENVLNHTYLDIESFLESFASLAFLRFLELASAPGEAANAYSNVPSNLLRRACGWAFAGRARRFFFFLFSTAAQTTSQVNYTTDRIRGLTAFL